MTGPQDCPGPRVKDRKAQIRLDREMATVEVMIRMFCADHHGSDHDLCAECAGLVDHARKRLAACPMRPNKPTCARCPIHCYRPAMRERIRDVMRYAGPRMLLRHPIKAVRHVMDGAGAVKGPKDRSWP